MAKSYLLPKAIREARKKCGLTQLELADRLGVSQATISFWENGAETPSLENQVRLVNLIPDIFELLVQQETDLLSRLYQLERAAFGDSCSCERKGIPTRSPSRPLKAVEPGEPKPSNC